MASDVRDTAHLRLYNKKYGDNYDHIFKKDKKKTEVSETDETNGETDSEESSVQKSGE